MRVIVEIFRVGRFHVKISAFDNLSRSWKLIPGSMISNRRNISQSPVLVNFRSEPSYGSYNKGPDVSDVFKMICDNPGLAMKKLWRSWSNEFQLFGKEMKFLFSDNVHLPQKGQIYMLFTFDSETCMDKWIVTTDKSNNQGFSTASFVRTNNETVLFSGNIDTTLPKDGKTERAGFASILTLRLLKSFKRFDTYDWLNYTHLVLKVRGDGRTYMIILGCPCSLDVGWQDQYHYPMYTRGGPYWQIVKIPFSNFYFTSRGRIQDRQFLIERSCSRVGITLADGISGPFKLEIEYFGLEYQPFHKDICPYEGYYTGRNVAC